MTMTTTMTITIAMTMTKTMTMTTTGSCKSVTHTMEEYQEILDKRNRYYMYSTTSTCHTSRNTILLYTSFEDAIIKIINILYK